MNLNQKLFEQKKNILLKNLQWLVGHPTLHPMQALGIQGLNPDNFTYENFASTIPVLTKKDIFSNKDYLDAVLKSLIQNGIKVIPAAGTTGDLLSFRFHETQFEESQFKNLAPIVEHLLKIKIQETLFLNAYPTGIQLPHGFHSVDCSAKPEVLKLSIKTFTNYFKNSVLICQPHFLKYAVLNKFLTRPDFENLKILVGGSWFPANFCSFLAHFLQEKPEWVEDRVVSLFGIAELGLGIGIQTPELSRLRNLLPPSPSHFFAKPMIYAPDSERFLVESVEGKLVLTSLYTQGALPLIRYQTGDYCDLIEMKDQILFQVKGRVPHCQEYPYYYEDLEEKLLSRPDLFELLTGNFSIRKESLQFEVKSSVSKTEYPHLLSELENLIQSQIPIHLETLLEHCLPFRVDLFRKPRPYEL